MLLTRALVSRLQAEAAYKRASELDANNMMAWQGFAELYSETGVLRAQMPVQLASHCWRPIVVL